MATSMWSPSSTLVRSRWMRGKRSQELVTPLRLGEMQLSSRVQPPKKRETASNPSAPRLSATRKIRRGTGTTEPTSGPNYGGPHICFPFGNNLA